MLRDYARGLAPVRQSPQRQSSLSVKQPAAESRTAGRKKSPSRSRSNQRAVFTERAPILVVDDDLDIRNAICAVLESDGFPAVNAANGKEGLELLSKLHPKPWLVLLDLWMPEMNGWDFHEHLSRDRELRAISVIIMTAFKRKDGQTSLKWLHKPIDAATLLEAVHASCAPQPKRSQRR
jgi:CheY-like chemotaxis protein